MVSSIRTFNFTVQSINNFFKSLLGNPVDRSCVPWNPLVGGYFFSAFRYKEPIYLLGYWIYSNLGNRLRNFRGFTYLELLRLCFFGDRFNRAKKSPPVSFLLLGTGLGAQRSSESTFDEFRIRLELNYKRWQIIKMTFLAQ